MKDMNEVMQRVEALAEELDSSQDENVPKWDRNKARRNVRGYLSDFASAGILVNAYDEKGEPTQYDKGAVALLGFRAKARLTTATAAKIVRGGGSLDALLTPLGNAILLVPLKEGPSNVEFLKRQPSPRGRKPKARPALPANTTKS